MELWVISIENKFAESNWSAMLNLHSIAQFKVSRQSEDRDGINDLQ